MYFPYLIKDGEIFIDNMYKNSSLIVTYILIIHSIGIETTDICILFVCYRKKYKYVAIRADEPAKFKGTLQFCID